MTECKSYPPPGSKLSFTNYGKAYSPSHIYIYNFEAYMDKTNAGNRCISQHKAFAYGYIIIDRRGIIVHRSTYKGADAATHFIESLPAKWSDIVKNMPYHPLHMTDQDQHAHNTAKTCKMCGQKFPNQQQKHRHHDHNYNTIITSGHTARGAIFK